MNSPRICSADARGGDATARVKLRAGATERLARPKELPKPFHEAYGDPFGYQFTWGQIIEEPNFVPDPATERYDGRMWRLVLTAPWQSMAPRIKASRKRLTRVLRFMRFDTVYCVEEDVPLPILCESGLDFEAARFITVSAAEANHARLWLVETFVVEQISAAISA
jgi:hypothetical protein